MSQRSALTTIRLAAFGSIVLAPSLALASEYCITCAGPSEMYRCVIDGSPEGRGKDMREQLACVEAIAHAGKHETCTASRSAPFPCPGVLKVVAAPIVVSPPPGTTAASQEHPVPSPNATEPIPPQTAENPAAPAAPEEAKVPGTVEELAKSTVANTKENLKKAGEAVGGTAEKAGEKIGSAGSAVGDAAKKSWRCLSSFFSDC